MTMTGKSALTAEQRALCEQFGISAEHLAAALAEPDNRPRTEPLLGAGARTVISVQQREINRVMGVADDAFLAANPDQ